MASERAAKGGTKSTEARLAEAMDIYAKLRDTGLYGDPDVAPLRESCRRYVRDAESADGSVALRSLGGARLEYSLRRRVGQPTYAVVRAAEGSPNGRS